ncbi:MAG: uroporphyrinogen decarboxylase family protein [Promethearchaeota archaeon]
MSEKKPRELYNERNQRFNEAIMLKEPDRVPIAPMVTYYPAVQKGLTKKEAMYEPEKFAEATKEVVCRYNWDQAPTTITVFSGQLFDALGTNFIKWPGAADETQRLEDHQPFQYVEGDYMKADEYEEFFSDPTGFFLRKIIPRHHSNLQSFSNFPNIAALGYGFYSMMSIPLFFASPDTIKMLKSLQEGIKSFFRLFGAVNKYEKDMKKLGYPVMMLNGSVAPFDVVGDLLRGMRGSMLDMYRRPEELKKMTEMLITPVIDFTLDFAKMAPKNKIVFIPLHRGADGFMSNKQFEEFYWPSLVKVMEKLIENGLIPEPFFEGGYNERLKYLEEFAKAHKGKAIFWFDKTDIIKAKEMFGDYACIRGNVPGSLLVAGNPQQVEDYVKKCIEGCAEGGGYIVDGGVSGIPDEAKHENVKAMTDAVFKYGVYRK